MILINKLPWDSQFFDMQIGCLNFDEMDETDLLHLEQVIKKEKYTLCYLFLLNPIKKPTTQTLTLTLVDTKVTFKKCLVQTHFIENVIAFSETTVNKPLLYLAIESGIESRFKKDTNFKTGVFEKLYTLWIENSVNKKIADETLVYKINNTIVGFVTLKKVESTIKIGLIAVNKKYRGKGIAKSLMLACENWGLENNCTAIEVVTQKDNLAACKLYENLGMEINKQEYVYHIWDLSMLA